MSIVNRIASGAPTPRRPDLAIYNGGAMFDHFAPAIMNQPKKRRGGKAANAPRDKETLTTTLSPVSRRWLEEIKCRYGMTHANEAIAALISDCRYRSPGTLHRVSEEEGEYRWKQRPEDHREESA